MTGGTCGDIGAVRRELAAVAVSLALLNAGCGGTSPPGSESGAGPDPGAQPTQTVPTTTEPSPTSPSPGTEAAAPASWMMPDLVGKDLQAAQDAIQALTGNPLFVTSSSDATGQGRAQVVDSNWMVCSQNVRPGDTITVTTKIEFAAVKLTERCP